jgi:hypothetical protein
MSIWLITCAAALISLVQGLALLAQPSAETPVPHVGFDAACAADLAARLTGRDPEIRVLACEPAGRGLAVIALGDPARAASVAVLVPGSDIDLSTLEDSSRPGTRPMDWARALHEAAGTDSAVVLWVGYPTPVGLGRDAATGRLARAAVPALAQDVARLRGRPDGPPHLTVIGHSYGAVVVSLAASKLDADALVLVASPGARASHVTDLRTSARVWAGRAPRDWLRWIPSMSIGDLGHGVDPSDPSFGALPLELSDSPSHDGYFRAGSASLASLAAVVTGAATGPGLDGGLPADSVLVDSSRAGTLLALHDNTVEVDAGQPGRSPRRSSQARRHSPGRHRLPEP